MADLQAPRALNFKNKVGRRYGRLLVIEFMGIQRTQGRGGRINNKSLWKCRCDCGNEKNYLAGSLATGRTKSCGCLSRETTAEFNRKSKTKVDTPLAEFFNKIKKIYEKHNLGGKL